MNGGVIGSVAILVVMMHLSVRGRECHIGPNDACLREHVISLIVVNMKLGKPFDNCQFATAKAHASCG